jgi:hypothetical protein
MQQISRQLPTAAGHAAVDRPYSILEQFYAGPQNMFYNFFQDG